MPRLRSALARAVRWGGPRLSVVVPVYNVEPFLPECLDSLLDQTFTDFEAIVVLDGPTDGSAAIAEEYARRDRRVRIVRQDNAGLSAARNAGVRAARGDYLGFLDADDTLPSNGFASLMETIERTGSDLAIGTLERLREAQRSTLPLMLLNHSHRREQITLVEQPLLLADVFAVNKVYRRAFWDRIGLRFPVGMRYEDQPTLTHALIEAASIDVIPETVYEWHIRAHESITQQRHEIHDLTDRIQSKRMSSKLVHDAGIPALLDPWFRDILPVDMWEYFRSVPGCSDAYWALLQEAVHEFWHDGTTPFEHTRVPVQQRLMGWLVAQGRREELTRVIAYVHTHRGQVPVEQRGDVQVALLPGVDDPEAGLPEAVYVLEPREHRPSSATGSPPPPGSPT